MNVKYSQYPDHHKTDKIVGKLREIVFGMEDGMVSTLGAITGIAIGSESHFTIVLSGCVIVAVESISMGVGSYVSNKSESDTEDRKIKEEKLEIEGFLEEEKKELTQIYIKDGWPEDFAGQMSDIAAQNPDLLLHEMSHHEHGIVPNQSITAAQKGVFMFVSYVIGGFIPLTPYLLLSNVNLATKVSLLVTLTGLFILGVSTTKFSKRKWWKAGLEFLLLASLAASVGYFIGKIFA